MSLSRGNRNSRKEKKVQVSEIGSGTCLGLQFLQFVEEYIDKSEVFSINPTVEFVGDSDDTVIFDYSRAVDERDRLEIRVFFESTLTKGDTLTLTDGEYQNLLTGDSAVYDISGTYTFNRFDLNNFIVFLNKVSVNKESSTYSTYEHKYFLSDSIKCTTESNTTETIEINDIRNAFQRDSSQSFFNIFGEEPLPGDILEIQLDKADITTFNILDYTVEDGKEIITVAEELPQYNTTKIGEEIFIRLSRSSIAPSIPKYATCCYPDQTCSQGGDKCAHRVRPVTDPTRNPCPPGTYYCEKPCKRGCCQCAEEDTYGEERSESNLPQRGNPRPNIPTTDNGCRVVLPTSPESPECWIDLYGCPGDNCDFFTDDGKKLDISDDAFYEFGYSSCASIVSLSLDEECNLKNETTTTASGSRAEYAVRTGPAHGDKIFNIIGPCCDTSQRRSVRGETEGRTTNTRRTTNTTCCFEVKCPSGREYQNKTCTECANGATEEECKGFAGSGFWRIVNGRCQDCDCHKIDGDQRIHQIYSGCEPGDTNTSQRRTVQNSQSVGTIANNRQTRNRNTTTRLDIAMSNWDKPENRKTYDVLVRRKRNVNGSYKNVFYVNGKPNETIYVSPNETIRFRQTNPSNRHHPFKISTISDGTHSLNGKDSTHYYVNKGVLGKSRNPYVYVTAGLHDLFYYCENHSGMGGKIQIVPKTADFEYPTPLTPDGVIGQDHLDWFLWFYAYFSNPVNSDPQNPQIPDWSGYPSYVNTSWQILGNIINNLWNQDGLNTILYLWGSGGYPLQSIIPSQYPLTIPPKTHFVEPGDVATGPLPKIEGWFLDKEEGLTPIYEGGSDWDWGTTTPDPATTTTPEPFTPHRPLPGGIDPIPPYGSRPGIDPFYDPSDPLGGLGYR